MEAKPVYDCSRSEAIKILGILQVLLLPALQRARSQAMMTSLLGCSKRGKVYNVSNHIMSAWESHMW